MREVCTCEIERPSKFLEDRYPPAAHDDHGAGVVLFFGSIYCCKIARHEHAFRLRFHRYKTWLVMSPLLILGAMLMPLFCVSVSTAEGLLPWATIIRDLEWALAFSVLYIAIFRLLRANERRLIGRFCNMCTRSSDELRVQPDEPEC